MDEDDRESRHPVRIPGLPGPKRTAKGKTHKAQRIPKANPRATGAGSCAAARDTATGRIARPLHTEHSVYIDSSQSVQQAQAERTAAQKRNTKERKTKKK